MRRGALPPVFMAAKPIEQFGNWTKDTHLRLPLGQ
jgi:hypothetical protein